MLTTMNDTSLRLYVGYARLRDEVFGAFNRLVTDERGQAGETSMLMRVSLVVAILLAIGGLIYAALKVLGADVAGDIQNPNW